MSPVEVAFGKKIQDRSASFTVINLLPFNILSEKKPKEPSAELEYLYNGMLELHTFFVKNLILAKKI